MKKLIILVFLFPLYVNAQNSLKAVIKDNTTKENLAAVTAYIHKLKLGAASDSNGILTISNIHNGTYEIVFSSIGYEKKEMEFSFPLSQQEPVEVLLKKESNELADIVVSTTRTNSRIEDLPIRIEVIGKDEVNEETNIKPTNISKLLLESSSIQAQQTSAVNGNVSIRLQGLDGKYTQLLKDGFPLYGGFAQGLSIMQIPPLDLKQVEIIKGSSSSLYGSDAIGGIINLISKQPQKKRELTFLANQTSLWGTDADGYFSSRFGREKKFGLTFLTANNFQKAMDVNKDGFSDLPKTKTFNVTPTFYYYFNPTATLRFGLNGTYDNRRGGDMLVLNKQADSLHRFFEQDISNRISSQLQFNKQFGEGKSLTIKNSVSNFNRSIHQASYTFAGKQKSSYTEASFNFKFAKQQFVTGINVTREKFLEDSSKSHLQRNYNYTTTGLFLQDDWKPTEKFSLETGLRTDYQNQFGFFVLPRLAAMYKFSKEFYVRAGSGLGYKLPTIFSTEAEEAGINNIQPLSKNIKAEKSTGGNLDFNYKRILNDESSFTINQSFFITQINNPLELDTFHFVNKSQPIVTKGFETNLRLTMDELQFFVGYSFVDALRKYNRVQSFVPLTPKNKINIDVIYEKEDDFSIAFEGYYVSSMYRDLDTKTKSYFTTGLIAQKHFKHFDLIANCENLFDVRQTRFENIIIPPISNPTFRQIYAPLDGRVFNVALRIKL
ncbi:MAG: TonB-dependent receptor [Bacteroidota bacterium]|nr:TonB-dependent receptor [Bacteroidota bacterium]